MEGDVLLNLMTCKHGNVEHESTERMMTPRAATKTESVKNNNPRRAIALAGDGSHEKNTLLFSFWSVKRTKRNRILSTKILASTIESVRR